MLEQITLGKLREQTKDLSDDTKISFMYREDILGLGDEDGKDFLFVPSVIWLPVENADNPEVILVSTFPPEELGEEDDDDEDDEGCTDPDCSCHNATVQ